MGRYKKYKTAAALKKGIERYIAEMTYQEPVVIQTPTGEMKNGAPVYVSRVLRTNPDGTGEIRLQRKWITPPSTAGLRLYLGVRSKATWYEYSKDEELGPVVEWWNDIYEAYLVERSETGKHISGVLFNLECNFGWKRNIRAEVPGLTGVKVQFEGKEAEEYAK